MLVDAAAVAKVRDAVPDLKESFEIGYDQNAVHKNKWPAEGGQIAGFREHMVRFFEQCHALNVHVMDAIATGMGLEGGFFTKYIDGENNTLRLLHYPEATREAFRKPGQVRAGEHTVRVRPW